MPGQLEMQAIVQSLPLDPWMTTDITPLSTHPSDPLLTTSPLPQKSDTVGQNIPDSGSFGPR